RFASNLSPPTGSSSYRPKTLAFRGCCQKTECRNFPLLPEEGWPRPQQNIAKPPFGANGVVIRFHRILLKLNTTPAARAKDALRRFLNRGATPPRRGGENSPPQPFGNSLSPL